MDNSEIAARLRRFGVARFGTMAELAKAMDMTGAALNSSYLSGRSLPGPKVLQRLHDVGCSADWLLFGVGLPPAPTADELKAYTDYLQELLKLWKQYRQALLEAEKQFGASVHAAAYIAFVQNQQELIEKHGKVEQ